MFRRGTLVVRARGNHWQTPERSLVPKPSVVTCLWLPSNIYPQQLRVQTVPSYTLCRIPYPGPSVTSRPLDKAQPQHAQIRTPKILDTGPLSILLITWGTDQKKSRRERCRNRTRLGEAELNVSNECGWHFKWLRKHFSLHPHARPG